MMLSTAEERSRLLLVLLKNVYKDHGVLYSLCNKGETLNSTSLDRLFDN